MPPCVSGIHSSETFELIAQSGQKRFFVHGDILTAHLPPPRTTTATGRQINLSDWDVDTVGRFVEFLYFAKYQVPEPTPEEEFGGGSGSGGWGGWSHDGVSMPGTTQTAGRRGGKGGRRLSGLNMPNTVQSLEDLEEQRVDVGVLLAHAKVYALAQYIGVEGLKIMALERFKTAIGEIEGPMSRGVAGNVTVLLVYIYSHTDTLAGSEKPMRDLMMRFLAENPEKLMQDVTEKFCDAEKGVRSWKRLAMVLERQKLEVANEEALGEGAQVPMTEGEDRQDHLTFSTLFILVVSVLAIIMSLFVQDVPRPTTIEERPFKGICQYNKASWVGGPFIMVEGKPLKEACSRYIPNPPVRQSSPTAKEIMKDMCHFYKSNSWVGSTTYSIRGKSLKEYCHGEDYTKELASVQSSSTATPASMRSPRTKSSRKMSSSTTKPSSSTRSSSTASPTSTRSSGSTKTSSTTKPTSSLPTSRVTATLSYINLYQYALMLYSCVSFIVGLFYYIFIIVLSSTILIFLIIIPLRISLRLGLFFLCMTGFLFGDLVSINFWPVVVVVGVLLMS